MDKTYVEDKTFNKNNFTTTFLPKGEYENCNFKNCDFTGSNLSDVRFINCSFISCNLSLAKIAATILRDVEFKDCKMLGLLFYTCNEFALAVGFDNCNLSHSSFYQRKIKKVFFKNSKLNEVDFSKCDLTAAEFNNCDLMDAKFENTILEKADFSTSFNYSIDPELNRIKKAKFSLSGVVGLLGKHDIEIVNE